ncbi:MAG: pyridoxamine 5'-phosphate oxidase family protein [Persephonella sp.]|nr:pyridoxamine 5'-phosphate oxidase family protein [Persephonella sp.]
MAHISADVLSRLKGLLPSVLATSRDNRPYTTFISWLILKDSSTVRFALSRDSYSAENLRNNPYASVEIFGDGVAMRYLRSCKCAKRRD